MIAKEDIEADIRVANAMKLVKDNAKITKPRAKKAESAEGDTEEKKPAAKKTAMAKKTTSTAKSTTTKKSTSTKKKTAEEGEKSE